MTLTVFSVNQRTVQVRSEVSSESISAIMFSPTALHNDFSGVTPTSLMDEIHSLIIFAQAPAYGFCDEECIALCAAASIVSMKHFLLFEAYLVT